MSVELASAFGKVLRQQREACGLSQEKLGLDCGLDRTYIGSLERAERQPTLTTLFALCTALRVRPSEMIRQVEERVVGYTIRARTKASRQQNPQHKEGNRGPRR